MKYTESYIQKALGNHLRLANVCIPNILMDGGRYEADILYFNLKRGVITEVEIKVDIQDFRNDFKKKIYHDSDHIEYLYYALPSTLYQKYREEIEKLICDAGIILVNEKGQILYKKRARKRNKGKVDKEILINYMRIGCMKWVNKW